MYIFAENLMKKYTYHGCCHNLLAPRVVELSTLRISMVLKNENNLKQVFLFSGEPLHKYNSICTGSENQQQTICMYYEKKLITYTKKLNESMIIL
jgi:hypothetical protein